MEGALEGISAWSEVQELCGAVSLPGIRSALPGRLTDREGQVAMGVILCFKKAAIKNLEICLKENPFHVWKGNLEGERHTEGVGAEL